MTREEKLAKAEELILGAYVERFQKTPTDTAKMIARLNGCVIADGNWFEWSGANGHEFFRIIKY